MADSGKLQRYTLAELEKIAEERGLENTERFITGDEALALIELHRFLSGQAKRDLIVMRMQLSQDELRQEFDMLKQQAGIDGEQVERLIAARHVMQGEIDQLRRQQDEDRARQEHIAGIFDSYTERMKARIKEDLTP